MPLALRRRFAGLLGPAFLLLAAGMLGPSVPNAGASDLAAIDPGKAAVPAHAARRHALVVGVSRYPTGALTAAAGGARAMARKLEAIGFAVKLLEEPSSGALQQALEALGAHASGGDLVFLYYAGHTAAIGDRLALMPADASMAEDGRAATGAIALDQVVDTLRRAPGQGAKLIVLDTSPYPVRSRFRGLQPGPPPLSAPPNFLIAQATGMAPSPRAGSDLSAYTQELVSLIGTRDRPASDVFEMVRIAVKEATNHTHVPSHSSSLPGDVYLAPPGDPNRAGTAADADRDARLLSRGVRVQGLPEPPQARLQDSPPSAGDTAQAGGQASKFEGELWNVIKESANPADFEAYLEVFPNGQYAKEAKQRISVLRAPKPAKPAHAGPEIEPIQAEYDVVVAANVREGPDLSASILRTVPKGERLTVTGRVVGRNWYQVRLDDGATAYVSSNLLRERPSTAAAERPKTEPPKADPKVALAPPREPALPAAPAGNELRDCPECPILVRLPAGSFRMGSEKGDISEQPAHTVRIAKAFAIGKYEVTIAEWKACAAAKACSYVPDLKDSPGGAPVHRLSWKDIQDYLAWLKTVTGHTYRLPSEAEWEYAARGGSERRYWWGDRMTAGMADCKDCGAGWSFKTPASVTASKPNPFGLHGTSGGVWEWTEDCWNPDYEHTPRDGSPAREGECTARVLRGGSWRNDETYAHAASRLRYDFDVRYSTNGFRVARDLP